MRTFFALLLSCMSVCAAWSPPAANVYDWTLAGIPGGIPTRTTIYSTLTTANSLAEINAAIAACPSNQVVVLSAGTYNIGRIDFNSKAGVTLRGETNSQGAPTTFINSSGSPCIGSNPSGLGFSGAASLSSGYTIGSTSIVFSATPNAQVTQDNLIQIGADDNANVLWTGASNGQRRYSTHRVLSKSGTTVTFTPPLPQTFTAGENPFASYLNGGPGAVLCGIEDLIIDQNTATYGVEAWGADRFYVRNVTVTNIVDSAFFFYGSCQIDIRHSAAKFALDTPNNSDGYGVHFRNGTSFSRCEDNIFQNLFVGAFMVNGCAGNVFSFNFSTNATAQGSAVQVPAYRSNHGACPMVNLFEGNVGEGFHTDAYHGNDIHLTLFRNWFHGVSTTGTGNRIMLNISRGSYYYVVVGNVLGGSWTGPGTFQYEMTGEPGYTDQSVIYRFGYPNTFNNDLTIADPVWPAYGAGTFPDVTVTNTIHLHGNWDYFTDSIINKAGEDTTLPSSLAYAAKPAYFGSLSWPPFNPSNPDAASPDDIPAGYRFINGQDPPADAGSGGGISRHNRIRGIRLTR